MDQATAQHKPETTPRPHRPTQAKAARAYQKTQLTEATEEEILETYAPVISQMVPFCATGTGHGGCGRLEKHRQPRADPGCPWL